MIMSALLFATGVLVAGTAIAIFWNSIVNWLKKAIKKVEEIVSGVVYGCTIFVRKIQEAAKEISKHYSKVGTKWQETIVEKNISYAELPEEIRNKVTRNNVDVEFTEELEMQLKG